MRGLATALGFLTVLPVPSLAPREGDLGRAAYWFPFVGALIGLILAGVDWGARRLWDPYVAAACVIAAGVLLTGGLHLDGLMDSADAFFSHRDRQGMLEVMRDSRAGALGVMAGSVVILAKFAAYGHLAGPAHWRIIALTPLVGRTGLVVGAALFPPARTCGLGAAFAREVRARHAVLCAVLSLGLGALLLTWKGAALVALALVLAALIGLYCSRRLGGLTGDVYGAINEITEVVVLLAASVSGWV